ncbi:hypothetical protein [Cryobacterium sp. MLB-32]|uniref:DUF7715 family protein n=1 Tax=Cryobacterium sp. MLB-32 TaxID=1529318 RepID=UPI0012E059E3|nr:hypothetical protein [Cryobacterium sp. MLB-32]
MKVLVATRATHGRRDTDQADCVEGELVWMKDPCDVSRDNPDGECACGRSFFGMSSDKETTMALVRDLPGLTPRSYERAMRSTFDAHGWCSTCPSVQFREHVAIMARLAAALPDGTIVGRRLDSLVVRPR